MLTNVVPADQLRSLASRKSRSDDYKSVRHPLVDDVSFAIECKSSEKPRKFGDFSSDLAKHVSLRDRFTKAVRGQIPCEHKRPSVFVFWTSGISITDSDKTRAKAERVPMLDEVDLEYYEQLVGQIGLGARFQFLADVLEGRAIPGLEITVPAIRARIG